MATPNGADKSDTQVKRPVTQPWQPARLLDVKNVNPNYLYRWVAKQNLTRKIAEGWEVITNANSSGENAPAVTLEDGTKITGVISKRNLILCKMPKELAASRQKYYEDINKNLLTQSIEEFKSTSNKSGAKTYGEIKIEVL